jgi:uncharacterized protein
MNKTLLIIQKARDLGEGIIEAVIASESKDRHGEILELKGLDTSKYMQNPVVLWAHNYSHPPIGKTLSLRKSEGKLIAKIQFAINEDSFAHKIYKLYKGGYMKAFSIGFIPKEMDENRYTKSEMLEHSSVPVPANDEALALAITKGVIKKTDLELFAERQKGNKMTLKEILAKNPDELNGEERAFLIENADELTKAQKRVYKEILAEDEPATEPVVEPTAEPAKEDDEVKEQLKSLSEAVSKITESLDNQVTHKNINFTSKAKYSGELKKEDKTRLWFKGLVTNNFSEYVDVVGKEAMTTDDNGAIIPPEEFLAEVSRLEEEYGVAARYVNLRRPTNDALRGIKGGDDLELVKTSELGLKAKQETSYESFNLTHLEYTGIVPISDTLLEDSAIDIWADLTNRFARANSKRQDELIFNENDTDDDVYGILNATGTAQISIGSSIDDFDGSDGVDALNEMLYAVPTPSMSNGRFYLHRTVLGRVQRMKDEEGRHIWQPGIDGGVTGTIWGMPYTLTEVMPSLNEIQEGDPFLIFGDLKNSILSIRVPMETKFFDSGVITDSDGDVLLNLMQQDAQAIRARVRMNQVHVHPEAYSVLVAGDIS